MEPCRSGSVRVPSFRSSPSGPSAKPSRPGHVSGGHSGVPAVLSRRQGPPLVATDQRHCASEDTLSHLINIIEQLKSKDKVISQLERELGHPAVLAAAGPVSTATEVSRHAPSSSPGHASGGSKMETPPVSPHHVLSGLQQVFQRLHGTGMTSFPLGGEEKGSVEGFAGLEAEIQGLHDRAQALALDRQTLLDKLKEFEVKNKQLVEKNKRFLEKNVQLTAHNRSLKDGSHTMLQQNKKLQDEAEDCRRKQCELARELQRVKGHNLELEAQAAEVEALRKQIADQTSSITLLRQACTDKDRRIELIQHRKKRRRLIRSQEKCSGVKETFYGYDDDDVDTSVDSETSQSSVSVSTISEEDACDELSREELERSHRQMLREHLQLERSHALLQAHTGSSQDPYRELQTRSQLQADLFSAQCRIELLEKEIRSLQSRQQGRGSRVEGLPDNLDVLALLKERDDLLSARHGLQLKLEQADGECVRLRQELRKAEERVEDLEFRILELEENPPCEGHDLDPCTLPPQDNDLDPHENDDDLEEPDPVEEGCSQAVGEEEEGEGGQAEVTECITRTVAPAVLEGQRRRSSSSPDCLPAPDTEDGMEFERLRRELKKALERQGVRADVVLKDLGGLKDLEQKVTSMERMAMEMQKKVIALQQERDGLEERLMRGAPLSLNAEVERRQNLELKEEIGRLTSSKDECCAENSRLAKQLEESEHLCISLQEQLKEFLEPSGSLTIGGQSILGPGQSNRADLWSAGEETVLKRVASSSNKYIQTDRSSDAKRREKQSRSRSRDNERAEMQALSQKVKSLQSQLKKLEAENLELVEKSMQQSNDSSSDDDDLSQTSIKHKPKQKVKTLERQLQVLHSENIRLADKLGGYSAGTRLDPEEVIERIVELEDHCTDLQDRMRETEGHERQTRDKLRVAEQTINELEISEAQYRDKCDELSRQERETKKQLHSLHTTGRELKEIILDKEILEQALKEKVEFLEKVEEQSSQRITELEAVEKSLREQLEARDSSSKTDAAHQTLKEKLTAAEQEVHDLKDRNNELEENEEILRENWRRVADEDANRLRCLEEKVRMLELTNQDLKTKLVEAQDFVVINSTPTQVSLAEELSASRTALARPLSDSPVSGGSDDESGEETPKKTVVKLKRQLSILEEEKNGKIANLQERLADLKENEIKLSETVAEMEMTERELRAKLALYESSEVTVEKMLKYQDKIHELRTSQESLLDQLETMETQEVTLQECLEETERRLKGKIVTLEVELKNLKQKELKGNARIRELEKHEEELTEKTKKQAEKENGLYVRISGLMDQLKEHKAKITEQEKKLAEKDERCRKVASLEAKFLQIEGAYREKVTALESNLAEAQSRLEEEEKQHQETKQSLDDGLQSRDKEHSQRVFILEEMFAQKEKGLNETIASLEGSVVERDRTISQHDEAFHDKDNRIAELEGELSVRESKIGELETITSSRLSKESELEKSVSLKDEHIGNMEKDLNGRDMKISVLEKDLSEKESRISTLEKEVSDLGKDVSEKESRIADVERSVSEKMDRIRELESDLDKKQSRIAEVERDVNENETLKAHLSKLESELGEKVCNISSLQQDLSRSESSVGHLEKDVCEKDEHISKLQQELNDRVLLLSQLEKDSAKKDEEVSGIVKDLSKKDNRISHLEMEICSKDSQIGELEAQLEAKDRETSNKLEEAHEDIVNRDRHIAAMGEQITKVTAAMSELEKKADEKDLSISNLHAQLKDRDVVVSEQMTKLQSKMDTEQKSASTKLSSLEEELAAMRVHLSQSEAKCEEYWKNLALKEKELEEEKSNVQSLNVKAESQTEEKERVQSELTAKLSDLEIQLKEQDRDFHTQLAARESEFHQACSSLDAECESLRSDLMEKGRVIEKLESTKNDLLSKIENLKDREKEAAKKLSEVEADLSALLVQKDSEMQDAVLIWDKKLKDAEQEKETAIEKACSLEADLLSSNRTVKQQLEEVSQLEAKLTEARCETETLQNTLSQLQHQEEEGRTQRELFAQQETLLKSRVSQVEAQLQAHQEDQEAQKLNVDELLAQKQRLEEDLLTAKTNLTDSYALNASLQETVSQLTEHTKSLQTEVADFQLLVKNLEVCQEQEKEMQRVLEQEKGRMQELESEISSLKDQRESALVRAENLQKELDMSKDTIAKLETDVVMLGQAEETLKSQISAEQSSRLEADRRLSESSEKATASEERTSQLLKESSEKDEEMDKLKVELLLLRQELQTQQRLGLSIEEKDQELYHLKEKEEAFKKREGVMQERLLSMENQMVKHQEDHSQMCQKLQELERREKELLEQITDIEQSVIVPLEAENAELKEEVMSMKHQTEALNLQIDKQEEQSGEDSAELEALRKTVTDLQVSHTEAKSRLGDVMQELRDRESDNELLQIKVADLEALNANMKDQLANGTTELDKLGELKKDLTDQETQTDSNTQVSEGEWQNLQQKLTVLQDAESKFMTRIVDLEEHEQQLSEELECLLKEKAKNQRLRAEESSSRAQILRDTRDASVDTEDLQETGTAKVPELFARVQELESANQRLSSSLEQATAGEVDRRQLTDRLHLLEQAEDRLMERVMELEESEVMLRTQLERSRHRANAADKLEEEVALLLQQEDEWKEKVASLTAENSALSEKLESLQSQVGHEQSKSDNLAFRVETEQRQLQDAQTELKLVQTKLQSVRSEYEEKLSALEESEKKMESQLDSHSQRESDLHREIQVLREEMEDLCERYKELELENSSLKEEHSKVLAELTEARSHGPQLAGGVSREPALQAVQAQTHHAVLPSSTGVSHSYTSSPDPQYSIPPQVCSKLTVQMVPSSQRSSSEALKSSDNTVQITQLKKDLKVAHSEGAGVHLPYRQGNVDSSEERSDSDSSGARRGSTQSVRVLTLHDALEENAALKAQLHDLQSRSVPLTQEVAPAFLRADGSDRTVLADRQSADVLQLQTEVSRLQSRVAELEKSLKEAEGAVQEVVTVVRTRSVHTLEQKIETIQHTIHTQSPGWSLHQELLELLTSQADLQKQVSHLMETEHNLRMALKQVEDELARVRSGSGVTSLGARRLETDRRLGLQSRLSRFGGGISSTKAQGDGSRAPVDSSRKTKEQWLERQVADLQLAKTNLERRLHEAERRLAFRPRPTSANREELLFRIEQLEEEQGEWRKKVEDLEALNSHYLKEKLELASEKDSLEHRLQTQSPGPGKEVNLLFAGGRREEPLGRSGSVSEGEHGTEHESDDAMRDKPEDVLQKRIKELENLESYLRQQLTEVESDREQLHEIARKDKATIHEQNVRLRELMLQERNLRSQVSGLEDSERSLYNRCSELEDSVSRLEDRVHELEVHERRLKELVRKLKLDEEVWLSKSGDLTASMEQLSSSEVSLRKMVQDLQLEKGRLSDRAEYLEVRVKELESLETTLVQRLKNYENVESSLQNRLQHTENSEAAAHSKASELDVINMDLSSRLQRAVEENAVLSQHVAQQQGQIHEMDRKLSAASDAQVGLTQHVESLQKSEAVLQKKVREYELRDIDAQARVRELEQTEEILKDKINQLQRNENRLKSRLVEFETVGSQVLENMPPAQRQQLPQQLEECQQRVVVLQRQLEAVQAETQPAEEDATSVKVPTAALVEMRSKVALLEGTEHQMSELEKLNAQLSDNILQLRQGKGSCGHEVELEVLKRRLLSYQNTIQKLKHHLSEGQVPSLRAADPGQGPESEDLPARHLQCLESERVLQSVRSLTQPPGLPHTEEEIVQAHSGTLQVGRAQGVASVASEPEESHWRTVELRCQAQQEGEPRGASASMPHTSATASSALPPQEELMMGVSLPSESERGSFRSQNDTDSERSGISHPHLRMVGSTTTHLGSPSTPGVVPSPRGGRKGETQTPPMPTTTSKPPTSMTLPSAQQQQRMNSGFVTDDSFYLPSSVASESESQEEGEAPPLPSSAPPGMTLSAPPSLPHPAASAEKTFVSAATLPSAGQKSGEGVKGGEGVAGQRGHSQSTAQQLQTTSVVGLSIRQRIAQIERQLKENPSRVAGSKAEEEDVFTWKAKATESARLLGAAEREGKQLKEDINKLEKDLEEKRRYIYIFEKWILDAEEVLKNKNKKNDRDLVQQLQTEVKHLKQDLGNAGYRKDDIFTDPAALKTEVDRRDRELMAKRSELESMAEEVQRWKQEASSVEAMRKNALDSLRMLETEVTQLQDADIQLKQMKDEYNTLRGQYDEVNIQKNKAVAAVHMLRAKVTRLAQKCQEKDELLRRLSEEMRGGRGRSSSLLEELTRLETLAGGEEYNRPLSPLDLITGPVTSDTERLMSERIPQTPFTRWSSTTSLGDHHDLSADVLHGGDKTSINRPRSAEPSRKGQHSAFPTKQPMGPGGGPGFGGETLCVAIMDYVPDAASRSGHRHLELQLKEGDHVEVRGPVDRHGYCEAEVGGRTGLVPASHLYPLTGSAATYRPVSHKHSLHKKPGVDSAEQIVQMFNELQDPRFVAGLSQAHSSQKSLHSRHSAATQTRHRLSITKTSMVPEAPSGLHIKEVDGNSLVLAWQPPTLDQHGCSNGCKVVGYRIYLNGRVCQQPHNPRLSHTRVDGVRSDRPQQLAIQTLAASGQVSSRVELAYQGGSALAHNHRDEDGECDTDLSSILNSVHYKTGKKRTVMGLYDYDPEKQSPGDYTACELAFSAGDVMLVYGEERQDGFFHGERNGKRGLVPACFVEPVVQDSKSTQKPGAPNGTASPRS